MKLDSLYMKSKKGSVLNLRVSDHCKINLGGLTSGVYLFKQKLGGIDWSVLQVVKVNII